jgi:hypothetical protein
MRSTAGKDRGECAEGEGLHGVSVGIGCATRSEKPS